MKTLHLLRHAKAEREPAVRDHERPLAKRGIRAAEALTAHLRDAPIAVDQVYCSSSKRTRETYDLVKSALGPVPVSFSDQLYLIDPTALIDFIRRLPDDAGAALLIGHDPGFHIVATSLAGEADASAKTALGRLRDKFVTGGLCTIAFNGASWRTASAATGRLIAYTRPRDLCSNLGDDLE